jgi:group I intron endonuclease
MNNLSKEGIYDTVDQEFNNEAVIYLITSPSGRFYIGSTCMFNKRMLQYKNIKKNSSQAKISKSILKYGWEAHKVEILYRCAACDRNKYEFMFGVMYNVISPENLNCKIPKYNTPYSGVSLETREKMSKAKIGSKMSEETKLKLIKSLINNNPFKGKRHTDETKKIISDKNKGIATRLGAELSQDTKNKIGIANKGNQVWLGRNHSEETKLKLKNIALNRPKKEEYKKHSFETKNKIRQIRFEKLKNGEIVPPKKNIVNIETGIFYFGVKEASLSSMYKLSYLKSMLNGSSKNKTKLMYI